MPARRDEQLARLSAECHERTRIARESNEDTRDHIERSRDAIERSLRLLGEPFVRLND